MAFLVEVAESGELKLPAEALGTVEPQTTFRVEPLGDRLIISPVTDILRTGTEPPPSRRSQEFREWANRPRPPAPDLDDEALRRENIYE
jgi:hypothetical protein